MTNLCKAGPPLCARQGSGKLVLISSNVYECRAVRFKNTIMASRSVSSALRIDCQEPDAITWMVLLGYETSGMFWSYSSSCLEMSDVFLYFCFCFCFIHVIRFSLTLGR